MRGVRRVWCRVVNRSADMTLRFRIQRQDDGGWPWVVTLEHVSPRGTGLPPMPPGVVAAEPRRGCCMPKPGGRICDACAIEGSIACIGAEDWLDKTEPPCVFDPYRGPGMVLDREGVLLVGGHMEWRPDDELFCVEWVRYDEQIDAWGRGE